MSRLQPWLQLHNHACKLAEADSRQALRYLKLARNRLWSERWWEEARSVALSALGMAELFGQAEDALEQARWLVLHSPNSDTLLLLGDALAASERHDAACHAWRRAMRAATREGAYSIGAVARSRLTGTVEETSVNQVALQSYRSNPRGALDALVRARRRALRAGATRDAARMLQTCTFIAMKTGDTGRATRFSAQLVLERPTAASMSMQAAIALEQRRWGLAEEVSRRALSLARSQGSLTDWLKAKEMHRVIIDAHGPKPWPRFHTARTARTRTRQGRGR